MSEHHEKRVAGAAAAIRRSSRIAPEMLAHAALDEAESASPTVSKDVAEELYNLLTMSPRAISEEEYNERVDAACIHYREAVGEGSEPHA